MTGEVILQPRLLVAEQSLKMMGTFSAKPAKKHGGQANGGYKLNVPTRLSPRRGTLSVIIRTYKAAVTMEGRKIGYFEFGWQSKYYGHFIRDAKDFDRNCKYIIENPIKLYLDENIPNRLAE